MNDEILDKDYEAGELLVLKHMAKTLHSRNVISEQQFDEFDDEYLLLFVALAASPNQERIRTVVGEIKSFKSRFTAVIRQQGVDPDELYRELFV